MEFKSTVITACVATALQQAQAYVNRSISNIGCRHRGHMTNSRCSVPIQRRAMATEDRTHQGSTAESMDERKRKLVFLRTSTGKGTQECYEALNAAQGDLKKALDIIRKRMDNCTSSSSTAEVIDLLHGRVATVSSNNVAVILEMRCETDFVSRNQIFISLTKTFANAAHHVLSNHPEISNTELSKSLLGLKCIKCGRTPGEAANIAKSALNEKMIVTRIGVVRASQGDFVTSYLHGSLHGQYPLSMVGSAAALMKYNLEYPDTIVIPQPEECLQSIGNTIGDNHSGNCCCMDTTECNYTSQPIYVEPSNHTGDAESIKHKLSQFIKHMVQHIVGAKPQAISLESFDPEKVQAARQQLEAEAAASGKPKETMERIVNGRIRKMFGEHVLMEQVGI
eukprot:XP_001609859.1 elongation factor TS [Babesia bovis T2Bo]